MKRFLTIILTGTMLISSLSVSAAGFIDVKHGDWFYSSVNKMTENGLFVGKGNDMFCPNDTMTKAEFLTVVARILYDEDNLKGETGDAWWSVYHTALVNGGVITLDEFKIEDMEKPMTRQEMSLVAVRALEQRGETLDSVNPNVKNAIPDYNSIGTIYRTNVVKGYQLGLLCGNDDAGTFKPLGSLDRASATMVLYRIVDPSVRIKKDFSTVTSKPSSTVVGQQTIREGEQSKRVPAKEGDIFIKKDGTQIVLKKGPSGVVGEGQGVAPDIGMYGTNGGYVISGNSWENQLMIGLINDSLHPYFVNGKGQSLNNNYYLVNATTGEGHWSSDWTIIEQTVAKPNYDGTTHGEVSKDAYSLYVWNDIVGMWVSNTIK
ncbi:MAG: S-layer homology domain-containing protein [Ruminococcaceae bacterium]|nr:S-layer homology domain-containing protein [Oscillospiraceae bacterium]